LSWPLDSFKTTVEMTMPILPPAISRPRRFARRWESLSNRATQSCKAAPC